MFMVLMMKFPLEMSTYLQKTGHVHCILERLHKLVSVPSEFYEFWNGKA